MSVLVDTKALARHRARAHDMFLQDLAASELQDRLNLVNRTFEKCGVVTPFSQVWKDRIPGLNIFASDETLALEQGGFDLVLHALDLHWHNDPVGQLIQCRRALAPDGLFLGAVLGGQTLNELRVCLAEAETSVSGGLSARVAPMAEIRDYGGLLGRAGFALPVADTVTQIVEYTDIYALMRDLRKLGETNALSARPRRPTSRQVFDTAKTLYHQHFGTAAGTIKATFELVILTGWAPHASQQQPLRPGSAAQRLADALGAQERKLPD